MGANRWVTAAGLADSRDRIHALLPFQRRRANSARGDGRLQAEKASGAPSDEFLYDPNKPVPTVGGNNCCGTHPGRTA